MTNKIINPDFPAAGVMISVNQLHNQKSDFDLSDWILNTGAFTMAISHHINKNSC